MAIVKYAPLVDYDTVEEYKTHFEKVYCRGPIETFDGIMVRFRKSQFGHGFYESSNRDGRKDEFSWKRARRIDWIAKALKDPSAELYVGWDKKRKRYNENSRVALIVGNYIVVIRFTGQKKAQFVTAFVVDEVPAGKQTCSTIEKIRAGPMWKRKNR